MNNGMSSRERAVGAMPPPQQQPEYKLLSPRMKWLYRIGFVVCLCVVAIAAVGVFAIADAQERKYRISNTRFADWVYSLVQFNQAAPGILLNGSLIGSMACFLQLRNDGLARQARLLANVKVLSDKEVDALCKGKKEGKKSR